MPILAKKVTESIFEIGIIVSMFSLAQILSELYFGRASDKKEKRLAFIRFGFLGCAITFGLHYFADNTMLLLIIRICAGITSGMMIPAMLAYIYESGKNKKKLWLSSRFGGHFSGGGPRQPDLCGKENQGLCKGRSSILEKGIALISRFI